MIQQQKMQSIDEAYRHAGMHHRRKLHESEETLFCPNYILKIINANSNCSRQKIYYSIENLIIGMQEMLGNSDMVIQPFIRQKHITKPCVLQYYMKNNTGVYKACTLVNKSQLDKHTQFYERIIQYLNLKFKISIDLAHQKHQKVLSDIKHLQKSKFFQKVMQTSKRHSSKIRFVQKEQEISKLDISQSMLEHHAEPCFNAEILLKHIQKNELCSIMDELVDDLRQENFLKYFTVSMSTGLEEMEMEYENAKDKFNQEMQNKLRENFPISIMKCQPSSKQYCEKATMDLYRLFTQHYFPASKFGTLNNFVCEFLEAENGVIYLNEIKGFECDFKIDGHDVRHSSGPNSRYASPNYKSKKSPGF